MAEGTIGFGSADQTGKNYVWRLNPLPQGLRWWINLAARDNAKGYAGFLTKNGTARYIYPFDFTPAGGTPSQEWTIGPGDQYWDEITSFIVYRESGTDPIGVTGYWRRP